MQQPVRERIGRLREEIAQIREANRLYLQGGKKIQGGAADQERRLQRLQEILDELVALTDWKKPWEGVTAKSAMLVKWRCYADYLGVDWTATLHSINFVTNPQTMQNTSG